MAEKDIENHLNCGAFLGIFFSHNTAARALLHASQQDHSPSWVGAWTLWSTHVRKNLLFYKSHGHTTCSDSVISRKGVFTASLANPHLPACSHQPGLLPTLVARCVHARLCLTLWPHGLQPSRLLCPRDFPGKNTGVGCRFLLQGPSRPRGWMHIFFISCIGKQIFLPLRTLKKSLGPFPVVQWLGFTFQCRGQSSITGPGAKTSHASLPKKQNIKQKQYCNKFNKDF